LSIFSKGHFKSPTRHLTGPKNHLTGLKNHLTGLKNHLTCIKSFVFSKRVFYKTPSFFKKETATIEKIGEKVQHFLHPVLDESTKNPIKTPYNLLFLKFFCKRPHQGLFFLQNFPKIPGVCPKDPH